MSQIKNRLKAAYENVEFEASSTWVHSCNAYQRANQELFIRENKVKDTFSDEPNRPRTVQDSIPQSRLAQYSNYEYNESRELCYASSATNVSFYYPCICKRSSIKEPWMIPEVEQLFIWFSYAPDFNILELIRLEEIDHLDEQERIGSCSHDCHCHDFHEVFPVYYNTFERTPGKSRFTSSSPILPTDYSRFIPCQLKIQTFEDMILRMKIKSDNVKYLWSDHSRHLIDTISKETQLNLLKSPLGNYFLLDNVQETQSQSQKEGLSKKVPTTKNHGTRSDDFGYLQSLAESLRTLEVFIFNSTKQVTSSTPAITDYDAEEKQQQEEAQEEVPKTEVLPTRRLYSAVLQGIATDNEHPSCTDVTSPTNSITKEHSILSVSTPTKTSTSSSVSFENISFTSLTPVKKSTPILAKTRISINSPTQWLTQSSHWGTPTSSTRSYAQASQEKAKYAATAQINSIAFNPTCIQTEFPSISSKIINLPSNTTIAPSDSELYTVTAVNPKSCSPEKTVNPQDCSVSSTYIGSTYANNNACLNNNNMCGSNNNQFNKSYYCNSQYPTNYQNSSSTGTTFSNNVYTNSTYQSNQPMTSRNTYQQFNRQPQVSNQSHIMTPHSMWFVQHNRPSSALYSVAHFTTQPYIILPPPTPPPPSTPPVTIPPLQNHRWIPPTHYIRTASTVQSYHPPITPQQNLPQLPPPQQWTTPNPYRTNSTQQITSPSHQFLESVSGESQRAKTKPKKTNPSTQVNFLQHKGRSRSPNDNSNEHLENTEVLSGTYSNMSMTYTKRSSAGSSDLFSLPPVEKPVLMKSAASTSSLDNRRVKVYNDYKKDERCNVEKRSSAIVIGSRRYAQSNFFAGDSEELNTLLPIAASVSEELERQALEQYQPSDEILYQELERQAEEQYNQDHSENWIGPPNENLLFGGQIIRDLFEIAKCCRCYIMLIQ